MRVEQVHIASAMSIIVAILQRMSGIETKESDRSDVDSCQRPVETLEDRKNVALPIRRGVERVPQDRESKRATFVRLYDSPSRYISSILQN